MLYKYLGTWYEIARFPHSFEKGLVGVTATYSLRKDGKIPDPNDPSRLKVSFFLFFYGDYYVLEPDKDYQWAMIGSSSPDYFWILSRTPQMDNEVYSRLLDNARKRGYNLDQLIKVEQPE